MISNISSATNLKLGGRGGGGGGHIVDQSIIDFYPHERMSCVFAKGRENRLPSVWITSADGKDPEKEKKGLNKPGFGLLQTRLRSG